MWCIFWTNLKKIIVGQRDRSKTGEHAFIWRSPRCDPWHYIIILIQSWKKLIVLPEPHNIHANTTFTHKTYTHMTSACTLTDVGLNTNIRVYRAFNEETVIGSKFDLNIQYFLLFIQFLWIILTSKNMSSLK